MMPRSVNVLARVACFLLPLGLAACSTVSGQAPSAQNDRRPLVLQGARVIVGDGRVIEDGAVLVQDGLLMDVGRNGAVTAGPTLNM